MSRFSLLLACLWWLVPPAAACTAPCVSVRQSAQVRDAQLTLGDVADVYAQADIVSQLETIEIGAAPAIGQARVVSRKELIRWVATSAYDMPELQWSGADQVKITRIAGQFDDKSAVAAARRELSAALGERFDEFSVEPAGNPLPQELPKANYQFKARKVALPDFVPARMTVWVELWTGQRLYRAIPIAFVVSAFDDVLRSTRALPVGAQPLAEDFVVERVEVTALPGAYWPANDGLQDRRLTKAISEGMVLMQSAIGAMPAVVQGETVTLHVRAGGILVEVQAQALQDGWPGRIIPVIPANAQEPVRARVVDVGLVELMGG